MNNTYDVIIIGLGAMGSATACHLARRGQRVLGLEQYRPGHRWGSSHGDSRIIREMYFEHPLYVPLVQRAYELWAELERDTGEDLMQFTGGLMVGHPDSELVRGARLSAETHGLPFEVFDATELSMRYPAYRIPDDAVGLIDPRAGFLRPESCIRAHLDLARQAGAELCFEEAAIRWRADGDGVRVDTSAGRYRAGQLLISAGGWASHLLPELHLPLRVERQTLFWLEPQHNPVDYAPDRFPIYMYESERGELVYGFPRLDRGLKTAIMHLGDTCDHPDGVKRSVDPDEDRHLRSLLAEFLPRLSDAPLRESVVCTFTNSPDHDFIIDFHPEHPQVLISSPCSGHGFKFSAAIGELQTDLLMTGDAKFDVSPFRLDRFPREDLPNLITE